MAGHVCIGLEDHFCACSIGNNHTEREHRDAMTERDVPEWRDFQGNVYTEAEAQRLWPWGHTLDRIRAGVGRADGATS